MAQHHGLKPLTDLDRYCRGGHRVERAGRFGRMFPDLPTAYTSPHVLHDVGVLGGPMDGGTNASRAASVPVGHVIFGQFIDHDITLDVSSSFSRVNLPEQIRNIRTPTLDLDCIYGSGPEAQPYLMRQVGPTAGKGLMVGADEVGADVLRRNDLYRPANNRAMIGDPRNDENRVISQLQLAMINVHNARCDDGLSFEEAREWLTWHYQWSVVNDFLVTMCGRPVVDDILNCGRKFYCPADEPFIPVEFSVAAYRFGHSMVPMKIQIQRGEPAQEFFGPVLGDGFTPVVDTKAIVDWHEVFFTSAGRNVQKAEKLNTKLARDLLQLPFMPPGPESSLATRNLLRGNSFLLPGGDKVAELMNRPAAEVSDVMEKIGTMSDGEITQGAPLWLYLLAEAEVIGRETTPGHFDKAEGLGPVGARMVAEVIIGLLELDEHSFLGSNRNWRPENGMETIGEIVASVNSPDL